MAITADVKIGGKLATLRAVASGENGRMQLALTKMLEAYARWTVSRFERMSASGSGVNPKGKSGHGPWDPLSAATLGPLVKVRRYLLILVRTGLLREMVRNGFAETGGMRSDGSVHSIEATFTPLPYPDSDLNTLDVMAFHQEGTDRIPQRKILWNPDAPSRKALAEIGKKVMLEGLES